MSLALRLPTRHSHDTFDTLASASHGPSNRETSFAAAPVGQPVDSFNPDRAHWALDAHSSYARLARAAGRIPGATGAPGATNMPALYYNGELTGSAARTVRRIRSGTGPRKMHR